MSLSSLSRIMSTTSLRVAVLAAAGLFIQATAADSDHVQGAAGLEGWTELKAFGNSGHFAFTLVIARHGKVVRRIHGNPYVWKWAFWENGRQIIYEAGPPHLAMDCFRIDLSSGQTLESVDCFGDTPAAGKLDWIDALERNP